MYNLNCVILKFCIYILSYDTIDPTHFYHMKQLLHTTYIVTPPPPLHV